MTPTEVRVEPTNLNPVTLKSDGSVRWNGSPISLIVLAQMAYQTTSMNPRPFTILEIDDGTNCSHVRVVRNLIDQQAQCQGSSGHLICGEGEGFTPPPQKRPKRFAALFEPDLSGTPQRPAQGRQPTFLTVTVSPFSDVAVKLPSAPTALSE
jgi:hypothetical protein